MAKNDVITKLCRDCKLIKRIDEFFKSKLNQDGRGSYCRDCMNLRSKLYREKNKAKCAQASRKWRNKNIDKIKQKAHLYYSEKYKDILKGLGGEKLERRKEILKAARKKWYAKKGKEANARQNAKRRAKTAEIRAIELKNPQIPLQTRRKEYDRRYLEKHPENRKKAQIKYRVTNLEKVAESNKKWRLQNTENCQIQVRNRRARIAKVGGSHTAGDIAEIRKMQNDCCAICKERLHGKGDVDHIVPIAKGGSNDRRNLQLAHRKCNGKKGSKDPIRFMQELGYLL